VIDDIPPRLELATQRVAIVMATYNGRRFVEEQIRSIQAQSYSDWMLYVRDDGSSDDTVQKVIQIQSEDHRVKLVFDELGNQGAIGNFSVLMRVALEANADYIFFSDQDDVWYPDKLAIMLAGIRELEHSQNDLMPLLVHCDLEVVDEELHLISDSFARFIRLSPTNAHLGALLCQNQVTGCACLINRRLLELACPVPSEVLMHDWWLALLAAASGKIGFIPRQLVKYRQHQENVLGAVPFRRRIWQLLFSTRKWGEHLSTLNAGIRQAGLLAERLKERQVDLHQGAIEQIEAYAKILDVTPLARGKVLRRHGIGKMVLRTGWVFGIMIMLIGKYKRGRSVV